MQSSILAPKPRLPIWAGRVIGIFVVLFLAFDSAIHLMVIDPVVQASNQLGYPVSYARALGVIELVSLVLYMVPRTSVLGAILLTGYLGGAVAVNLRVGNPFLSHVFFPVYLGVLIWAAIYLRDDRVRAFIPVTRPQQAAG